MCTSPSHQRENVRHSRTNLRISGAAFVLAAVVIVVGIGGASGATTKHKTTPKKINLSGVTLNVGDLAGQTQILLNDSGALKGAQYKVTSRRSRRSPAVAAIQGGSIDLTVTADTPAIFAQAGGVALKSSPSPSRSAPGASLGLVVPKGSTITTLGGLKARRLRRPAARFFSTSRFRRSMARRGWKNATIVNLNPALALGR